MRQLPDNRWAASRGIFKTEGKNIEYINRRPNFFDADKIGHLDMETGIISDSVGVYRAYRIPRVVSTVSDIEFYAMGDKAKVQDLLTEIPAVGKKPAVGYGFIAEWSVENCDEDYSLWHPEYGLMRPVVVGSDEAKGLDLSTYPVMQYGIKPPYWKPCNMRLCHVPIATAENATT